MVHQSEVNQRSPLRVLEAAMHGGLGRGQVGLIASKAGVGKKALLVQIALDDLMRGRKVLHVSHEYPVEHIRSYYDELFHDLAEREQLDGAEQVRTGIERQRLILAHLGAQDGRSAVDRLEDSVQFARETVHFEPDVIVLDGFDLDRAGPEGAGRLQGLARELEAELWVASRTDAAAPAPDEAFAVVVTLETEREAVRLRLLKDHDAPAPGRLPLRLDPRTMRVVDEDLPPPRPRDPSRHRLLSGGSRGAEAAFGAAAERWGVAEVNYSFEGHRLLERTRGVVVLDRQELEKGDFSLLYCSHRMQRALSEIPLVRNVLQTIWHQVHQAQQVFVVGTILEDGHVKGGTGWGAELGRIWKKPLWVYDQPRRGWFHWTDGAWAPCEPPLITSDSFAGMGTQNLTDDGRAAIDALFERSFG